jgi:hypothetical protein
LWSVREGKSSQSSNDATAHTPAATAALGNGAQSAAAAAIPPAMKPPMPIKMPRVRAFMLL